MTHDQTDLRLGACMDLLVKTHGKVLEAARDRSMQRSPVENTALHRCKFRQHRSVYDGNGEYEFATARHYVPQYSRKPA